jgi:hypothetical protein
MLRPYGRCRTMNATDELDVFLRRNATREPPIALRSWAASRRLSVVVQRWSLWAPAPSIRKAPRPTPAKPQLSRRACRVGAAQTGPTEFRLRRLQLFERKGRARRAASTDGQIALPCGRHRGHPCDAHGLVLGVLQSIRAQSKPAGTPAPHG